MTQMQDIPKTILPVKVATESQAISRIIWQTFESNNVPNKMYEAAMSWSQYNQEYEYRFHDKDDRVNLIKNNFKEEVLEAYHRLDSGAFKADLWRYCALYVYGGVYADIDTTCTRMLSKLIKSDDQFIVPESPNIKGAVFNAFICSVPEHPFLKKAINRAARLILADTTKKMFVVTGPSALGRVINSSIGRDGKEVIKVGEYCESDLSFRILKKIPRTEENPSVMDGDEMVCLNKYDGYMQDLKDTSVTYWKKNERKKQKMKASNKIKE